MHAPLPLGVLLVHGLVFAAQATGLATAVAVRYSEGSRRQPLWQCLFLGSLVVAGLGVVASLALGPNAWLPCGISFSMAIVGATCEFRRADQT